uniref:Putative secreted protein n=1 Tax=Ixodes ricinus TaxID=34613 RepID=A0A147BPY4_IXORI
MHGLAMVSCRRVPNPLACVLSGLALIGTACSAVVDEGLQKGVSSSSGTCRCSRCDDRPQMLLPSKPP